MTEKPLYKLEIFEGPMDLLLNLISKRKVSINDVPILELIEQYLDYVKAMQVENLDIASEFLEMAARLIYIKTVSLLPVHDEADRLTEELKGELTEYLDCQLVAGKLSKISKGFDYLSREPVEFEENPVYTRIHEPSELFKAYLSAVGKGQRRLPPPIEAFNGIVAQTIVSVSSRISKILRQISVTGKLKFLAFFEKAESKSELVATFLALLTLSKAKRIKFTGEQNDLNVLLIKTERGSSKID